MKKEIKCVICGTKIGFKESYFKVELFEKGKSIGTDYSHKTCWFNQRKNEIDLKSQLGEAINMLKNGNLMGMVK